MRPSIRRRAMFSQDDSSQGDPSQNRTPYDGPAYDPLGHPVPPGRRWPNASPPAQPSHLTRNRTAEIVTISILVAGFMLLGLGAMLWAIQTQIIAWGPTPTPTATAHSPSTATPDFRTTRVVADFLTQQAYQVAQSGTPLPTLPITPEPAGEPDDAGNGTGTGGTDGQVGGPTATSNNDLYLPLPGGGSGSGTDSEASDDVTPEPGVTQSSVRLPILAEQAHVTATSPGDQPADQPGQTPTVPATDVVTPGAVPPDATTPTPPPPTPEPSTATPTIAPPTIAPPTETPTVAPPSITPTFAPPTALPTPGPTGQAVIVGSLRGFVGAQDANFYVGPSNLYTRAATIAANTEVRMLGRTPSGEWIYVCCVNDNEPVWVRHAYVEPRENPLPPGVPEETDPNDVRFLNVQPAPSGLVQIPSPTPLPENTFPMARYGPSATGLLPSIPVPPLELAWPSAAQAGQAFVSPAIVGSAGVLAGSADNHLYSFDRVNGNQRWRYNVGQPIRMAPLIYDNEIFVADETGHIFAFEDRGNQAVEIWNSTYGQPAITSFNVYSDTLFIGVGQGTNHILLAIDRDNGAVLRQRDYTGPGLRYPVIGDQLVYVADSSLVALDVFNFEAVWQRGDVAQSELVNLQTAPVYGSPGVQALAELYIVDGNNRIWALDANTGETLWSLDNGEAATSLALTPSVLLVAGNGYIKAISREDNSELWRGPLVGTVLGGLLTDGDQVLAVTQGGNIQVFDATTGDTRGSAIPSPAGGAAAVAGPWLYVPGTDGQLYALRGTSQ